MREEELDLDPPASGVTANESIAIGSNAKASNVHAIAIGYSSGVNQPIIFSDEPPDNYSRLQTSPAVTSIYPPGSSNFSFEPPAPWYENRKPVILTAGVSFVLLLTVIFALWRLS